MSGYFSVGTAVPSFNLLWPLSEKKWLSEYAISTKYVRNARQMNTPELRALMGLDPFP